MASLEILNPVGERRRAIGEARAAAPRPRPCGRLASNWNMKAGGAGALDRTEQLLRERFPGARFKRYTGSVGWLMRHCTAEDPDRIAAESTPPSAPQRLRVVHVVGVHDMSSSSDGGPDRHLHRRGLRPGRAAERTEFSGSPACRSRWCRRP